MNPRYTRNNQTTEVTPRRERFAARHAKERDMEHLATITAVIEEFAPRFVPGGILVHASNTGDEGGHFDKDLLAALGIKADSLGKLPDVVLRCPERDWLLLVDSVMNRGPVDEKRRDELAKLLAKSTARLVYVTAFPSRTVMARYLREIAWGTEAWCADAPTHLIHFNGGRLLGPYL